MCGISQSIFLGGGGGGEAYAVCEWRDPTHAMDLSNIIADSKGFIKLQGYDVHSGEVTMRSYVT